MALSHPWALLIAATRDTNEEKLVQMRREVSPRPRHKLTIVQAPQNSETVSLKDLVAAPGDPAVFELLHET